MTPDTEIDQVRQQNALLLKRLLAVSRERDRLATQIVAAGCVKAEQPAVVEPRQ